MIQSLCRGMATNDWSSALRDPFKARVLVFSYTVEIEARRNTDTAYGKHSFRCVDVLGSKIVNQGYPSRLPVVTFFLRYN
jgi:hypothetical protein